MGKARKPMSMQKGNITSITKLKRERQEQSVRTKANQLTRPPEELIDEVAAKEWRRVVKLLKEIDIVGNLDRANLIGYCNAYSSYLGLMDELKRIPFDTDILREARMWGKEYRDFGRKLGLDPDSRLKLAAVKAQKEEDALEQKFGAI